MIIVIILSYKKKQTPKQNITPPPNMAHTKSYTLKHMYKQRAQYEHSHSGMLANTHMHLLKERD